MVGYVWNIMKKYSYKTKIQEDSFVEELNNTHPFDRGTILYEYLSNKTKSLKLPKIKDHNKPILAKYKNKFHYK